MVEAFALLKNSHGVQGLDWEEVDRDGCVIFRLRGNIALYNSRDLEKRVNELADTRDCSIMLNLEGISYFDSRGMGFFLDLYKRFEELPGHFALIAIPPGRIQHFKISGLLGVIKVFDTEDQALAELRPGL